MEIRDAAARYCEVVESVERYDREDFVVALLPALSGLISAGAALPFIELPAIPGQDDHELPSLPRDAERETLSAIGHVLADWDIYWMVDPLSIDETSEPEILAGSLPEDLAEVWCDLKAGLIALAQGGPEPEIQWEWRFGFYTHWGRHATHALTVLHARMNGIKTQQFRVS